MAYPEIFLRNFLLHALMGFSPVYVLLANSLTPLISESDQVEENISNIFEVSETCSDAVIKSIYFA